MYINLYKFIYKYICIYIYIYVYIYQATFAFMHHFSCLCCCYSSFKSKLAYANKITKSIYFTQLGSLEI